MAFKEREYVQLQCPNTRLLTLWKMNVQTKRLVWVIFFNTPQNACSLHVPDCLKLYCVLEGNVFRVRVDPEEDILDLKDEMKKASHTLKDVDVFELRLWKINADEEARKLTEYDMVGQPLDGTDGLSKHWQGVALDNKNTHVFVAKPSSESMLLLCPLMSNRLLYRDLTLPFVRKSQINYTN